MSRAFIGSTWIIAVSLGALAALIPATASAQANASEKASAEALFDEGLHLLRAGKLEEARAKLETSQELDPGVGTLLYLGECYERLGRTASAWASFREAASLAESSNRPDRKKLADTRAAKLEPDLAWLRFEIAPETRALPGLEIRRASVLVPIDLGGSESPVDPGEILVEASAPGHAPFSAKVTAVPKGRSVVTIPWLRELPPEAPPPAAASAALAQPAATKPAQAPASAPPPPETHRSVVPYIVGGVGLVGIGVGAAFGVRANSKASDARDGCDLPGGLCTSQEAYDAKDSAEKAAVVSNVAFAVGGTALAAGVVLFFVLPKSTQESALRVTPRFDRSYAGLSVSGRLGL